MSPAEPVPLGAPEPELVFDKADNATDTVPESESVNTKLDPLTANVELVVLLFCFVQPLPSEV